MYIFCNTSTHTQRAFTVPGKVIVANKYILEPTYIYAKYTNSRTKHIKLDKILEVPVENKTDTRRKDVKTFDGAELLKVWPKYADSRAPELITYKTN
nr:uncharacterized protein LOC118877397 isoform X2 [Drosophila suzukii]XP_036674576.1 uncharacterized protein LOC118877947 isoform X2 [Drosophila suzukii]